MPNTSKDFPACTICGVEDWRPVLQGPVRDGAFGAWRDAEVRRCAGCGVDRLAESACLQPESYESAAYREQLGQNHDAESHFRTHDELARFSLDALWPISFRGKVVADIGCGGGALLDHLRGLTSKVVAVDPAHLFSQSLASRGYDYFPSAAEAAERYAGKVDIALSTQVIEHVENPRAFLHDIAKLLKPDGIALVSTPNRRDILMELLPDKFPSFFYRSQHRWAFDGDSLACCARHAGFVDMEVRYVHRYGISNTLFWLKEGKPRGRTAMGPIDQTIDKLWQAWLEGNGRADNVLIILRRSVVTAEKRGD